MEKTKILVIDDDVSFYDNLQFMLGNGFLLSHANTEEKGLDFLQQKKFHLVLLDLSLVDGEETKAGLKLVSKIKNLKVYPPIIIVTNYSKKSYIIQTLREGANDYLLKEDYNTKIWKAAFQKAINTRKKEEETNAKEKEEVRELLANNKVKEGITKLSEISYLRKNLKDLQEKCINFRRRHLDVQEEWMTKLIKREDYKTTINQLVRDILIALEIYLS